MAVWPWSRKGDPSKGPAQGNGDKPLGLIDWLPFGLPCCNDATPFRLSIDPNSAESIAIQCPKCKRKLDVSGANFHTEDPISRVTTVTPGFSFDTYRKENSDSFYLNSALEDKPCAICSKKRGHFKCCSFYSDGPGYTRIKCHQPPWPSDLSVDLPFGAPCCKRPLRIRLADDYCCEPARRGIYRVFSCQSCKAPRWMLSVDVDNARWTPRSIKFERWSVARPGPGQNPFHYFFRLQDCAQCGKENSAYEWDQSRGETNNRTCCNNCKPGAFPAKADWDGRM
jgi:hypothetical protein